MNISFVQVCLGLYQERVCDEYQCLLFLLATNDEIVHNCGKFSIFFAQTTIAVFLRVGYDSSIFTTASSYHRRIQMIKRDENVHKRTSDDNNDV